MNHKYNGTMGFQRLIKTIKSGGGGGGGAPGADSVSSSTIIDGTIANADIANGAIDETKLDPNFYALILEIERRVINLEKPGWYGSFMIKNNNASDPYWFYFEIWLDTFNTVSNTTDSVQFSLGQTLFHNQQYELVVPIGSRLTNEDTFIRIVYIPSAGDITSTSVVGIGIDAIANGEIIIVVDKQYLHNGYLELDLIIS